MHDIGEDFGLPTRTVEDQKLIFDSLGEILQSFVVKGPLPKASRWFSWHEAAEFNLKEFHGSKMLYEYYFGESDDFVLTSTFQAARKNLGGLKLAYKCLCHPLCFEIAHLLLEIQRPCWSWYTEQIKDVKTMAQQLQFCIKMALGWNSDWHLQEIASFTGDSLQKLQWIADRCVDQQDLAERTFKHSAKLLTERAASLSRHGAPPFCYAELLTTEDNSDQIRRDTMDDVLKNDWQLLMALEMAHLKSAQDLVKDMRLTFDAVCRLMCHYFETSGYNIEDGNGLALLKLMIGTLPDSKIVEDIHKSVRIHQKKAGSNQRMTKACIQSLVQNTKVIEERGWNHTPAITKEFFLERWSTTSDSFKANYLCNPSRHKLDPLFSMIMGRKNWATMSEPTLTNSAAAWAWARHYQQNQLKVMNVRLQDFLCLLLQHVNVNLSMSICHLNDM